MLALFFCLKGKRGSQAKWVGRFGKSEVCLKSISVYEMFASYLSTFIHHLYKI